MTRVVSLAAALLLLAWAPPARAQATTPPAIVAAENFYGDVAQQVAGPGASVTSILTNPEGDPHLFEASPSTARALSAARVVVYNGLGYDPWMTKLLAASRAPGRQVVVVGDLLRRRAGANPHLWYDPAAMPAVARALAAALAQADPANRAGYEGRLDALLAAMKPVEDKVAALRTKYAGTPVTATEPVFGLMASALGLSMRNERFQLAVMNGTEPRASDVAAFERDLRDRRVRVLIYNSQATNAAAQRLLGLAQRSNIPVLGVTETQPPGTSYQGWMLAQLEALEKGLAAPAP